MQIQFQGFQDTLSKINDLTITNLNLIVCATGCKQFKINWIQSVPTDDCIPPKIKDIGLGSIKKLIQVDFIHHNDYYTDSNSVTGTDVTLESHYFSSTRCKEYDSYDFTIGT